MGGSKELLNKQKQCGSSNGSQRDGGRGSWGAGNLERRGKNRNALVRIDSDVRAQLLLGGAARISVIRPSDLTIAAARGELNPLCLRILRTLVQRGDNRICAA